MSITFKHKSRNSFFGAAGGAGGTPERTLGKKPIEERFEPYNGVASTGKFSPFCGLTASPLAAT